MWELFVVALLARSYDLQRLSLADTAMSYTTMDGRIRLNHYYGRAPMAQTEVGSLQTRVVGEFEIDTG